MMEISHHRSDLSQKRQFTSIALVLWSHFGSGQFIAYPRLAGEKVVGCIGLPDPWIAYDHLSPFSPGRESAHEQSRPHH